MTLCNQCGDPVPANRYGHTSTLCAQCVEEYDDYYRNEPEDDLAPAQGKRDDQLCYSGGVLIVGVVLLALLLAGLSIGAWVAYWTTPMP